MPFGLFLGFFGSEKHIEYSQSYPFNETNTTTVKKHYSTILLNKDGILLLHGGQQL